MTGEHRPDGDDRHGGDPPIFDAAFWDERYRSASALWTVNPNPQLVAEAADLVPGTVLDVGCGEGADACWMAEHGWQVTAVDISTVALERGAAHASALGPEIAERIAWLQADFNDYVPVPSSFDVVSAQFMHLPKDQRELLHRRLAASVAPGGTLLVVGHHPSDLRAHGTTEGYDVCGRPPQVSSPTGDPARGHARLTCRRASRDHRCRSCSSPPRRSPRHSMPTSGSSSSMMQKARTVLDREGRPVMIHDAVMRAQRNR